MNIYDFFDLTNPDLWRILAVISVCYAAFLIFISVRYLTAKARIIFAILMIVLVVILYLYATREETPTFYTWFISVNREFTLPSMLSPVLLFAVALLGLVLASGTPGLWRAHWSLVAIVMLAISIDEYFAIHETHPWLESTYPKLGVFVTLPFVALSLLGFFRQRFEGSNSFWNSVFTYNTDRLHKHWLMVTSGFVALAFGGVYIDSVIVNILCLSARNGKTCHRFYMAEEGFEFWGAIVILVTLISAASLILTDENRRRLKLVLPAAAIFGGLIVFHFWGLPVVEARWMAQPVDLQLRDKLAKSRFEVIGYRISQDRISPGDSLRVTLYGRTLDHQPREYGLSTHLMTLPDYQSLSQDDQLFSNVPTTAWLPGLVYKQTLTLDIPEDIVTPHSYALSLGVWQETYVILIDETDRPEIGTADIILTTLPALPQQAPEAPPNPVVYTFADGIRLSGYSLQDEAVPGGTFTPAFWWQTEQAVDLDLTQFVHLVPVNPGDQVNLDQKPFGGAFPTYDWPADLNTSDEWDITLPPDVPPGEYQVYTGLYRLETGERIPVADENGELVADAAIYLGDVMVTTPGR